MKVLNRVDFLHYGEALQCITGLLRDESGTTLKKDDFLKSLVNNKLNCYGRELIHSFSGVHNRNIDVGDLKRGLIESKTYKQMFARLGCRGFSYLFAFNFHRFSRRLHNQINLRFGLLADRRLFYPHKVRQHLRSKHQVRHLSYDQMNSIAFALGREIKDNWFILVMQSDIAYAAPACLRGHFRGWRKVLFNEIAAHAKFRNKHLHLLSAHSSLQTCRQSSLVPLTPPESWRAIYDMTAREFSMNLIHLNEPVDIQLYPRQQPIFVSHFFSNRGGTHES
jgi:hypothetical protein